MTDDDISMSDNKSKLFFHYVVPIWEKVLNPSHGEKGGGSIQGFAIGGAENHDRIQHLQPQQ